MVKNEVGNGYLLKLTSIGSGSWQLFISKINDSSDFVRVVYGVTEQVGGGTRKFRVLKKCIIVPSTNNEPVFVQQFDEFLMKNRRVWIAFEAVKRNKGKRGTSVGAFIALSPMQSKWRTTIGSTTTFEIKPLDILHFKQLYSGDKKLGQGFIALLNAE